ncbi:hypothetical protein SDC9_182485 [bioreactor metagenome]|uniref:Uncharacterized protein n=1 Tax=bioreactor metagenome TaxID=1076179 RepID=A0A645H7K0_9ZZZZ
MGRRHPVMGKEALHGQRIAMRFRFRHHQLRPGDKRPEEFPHRDVKAARRFLRHHILRRQSILVLHPQQTVNNGGLPDHHSFRSAR